MPIVTPEIIRAGEKELFSSMLESFDEFKVEKLFQDIHGLLLKEKMKFKEGKTIVYNNQIVYKFDFQSIALFSVLVDEMGRFSGFTDPNAIQFSSSEETESDDKIIDPEKFKLRKAEFLESLSETISHRAINELFRKIYKIESAGKMIYRHGEIRIFNDHVTYQFHYEIEAIFSIFINREGNYINTSEENNVSSLEEDTQRKLTHEMTQN